MLFVPVPRQPAPLNLIGQADAIEEADASDQQDYADFLELEQVSSFSGPNTGPGTSRYSTKDEG
jgi:hypothetical protein